MYNLIREEREKDNKTLRELAEMERLLPPQTLPKINVSNDEYISLCGDTIVYRNMSSTNIFKFIKDVPQYYSQGCKLLLVRQIEYSVQLLWTGTIPLKFQIRRQPVTIVVDKTVYDVVSSISIAQDGYV